jgi:hypothetical protein
MKTYGGVDVQIHDFFTSALVGGKWSALRPGRRTPGERVAGTHWMGGPQDRCELHEELKILVSSRLELRPFGRSARSQSLYRLRCRGCLILEHSK